MEKKKEAKGKTKKPATKRLTRKRATKKDNVPEEEKAFFGAGCFWNVEEAFRRLKGVKETVVGYMSADESKSKKYPNPTYHQVCSDRTGFVETTEVVFNPQKISYEKLLKVFWKIHDPTQMNRQGPDVGSQYKSMIFFANPKQKREAEISKKKEQIEKYEKIVTEIKKAGKFYRAEDYHQKYLMKRGLKTCRI